MNRIEELDQEINRLKNERSQLIRAKTVTMGQLMDVAEKYEDSSRLDKMAFALRLLGYISELED